MDYNLNTTEYKTLRPGFEVKFIHTEHNTIAYFKIAKGAELPMHHHMHTQTTTVLSGELQLTLNGETKVYCSNEVCYIKANEPHSAIAITDCTVLDVFFPVREDYLNI
jgi:quercetin dioxygenase-like cupin family protein